MCVFNWNRDWRLSPFAFQGNKMRKKMCVFFFPLSNSLPELMASLLSVVIRVPAPVHTNISRLFFVCFFLQSETNKQKMSFRLHVYVRTEHNTFQKKQTDAQTNQDTKTSFSPQFSFFKIKKPNKILKERAS